MNVDFEKILKEFPEKSNVGQFIKGIGQFNSEENSKLFMKKYRPIIESEKKEKSPFLSVIIRTQGKREEGLREALLCMHAQSNQSYEIILIGHKINAEQKNVIERILDEQEEEFRNKIRFFQLGEGTRTTPLNFGFAHAWGEYVAVFDDDDILFDSWVDNFYECAKENRGKILHSYAFAQNWENVVGLGYRAVSAPVENYCKKFDLLNQLFVNRCPLMTLAFPSYIFQKIGIIFNEDLQVTEDWEYFMRVSFLCGVADICEPTAIYRFWENIETSATLHDQETWNEIYKSIQTSFDKYSIILPSGYIGRIIHLCEDNGLTAINDKSQPLISQLYYSKGKPFDSRQVIKAQNNTTLPNIDLWFLFEEKTNQLTALRFDLCEDGLFILKDLQITIWFTNGEKREVNYEEYVHNGLEQNGAIFFINEDPEIVWEIHDERLVDVVNIKAKVSRHISRISIVESLANLFPIKKIAKKRKMHKKGYF